MAASQTALTTTPEVALVRAAPVVRSNSRRALQRFMRNRLALAGATAILLLIVVAVIAPSVALQSPTQPDMRAVRSGPSAAHWLGTDDVGRDVSTRLVHRPRTSLALGFRPLAIPPA